MEISKKNRVLHILILVVIILTLFYCFYIFYLKDKINSSKVSGEASVDYCINNVYSSHYLSISLECPEGLIAQEINNGFQHTPKEGAYFIKNDSYKFLDRKKVIFSLRLVYEKFNPNNVEEYSFESDSKQVDTYKLINEAEAVVGPMPIIISNLKEVTIGNNKFYAYSFSENNDRKDVFVLTKDNNYIKFYFNNQKEEFIKTVLKSVKRLDNGREENIQSIKKQVLPIIESFLRKTGKLDKVKMSTLDIVPHYETSVSIEEADFEVSEDENTVYATAIVKFKGDKKSWDSNLKKYSDWHPIGQQVYRYKLVKIDGKFHIVNGPFFNKDNNGKPTYSL